MTSLCEYIRQQSIKNIFQMGTMQKFWPVWQRKVEKLLGSAPYSANDIILLGDHLGEIFSSTGESGRGQDSLSGGGAAWEGLVCWYMNLCLIGSRAVVIKQSKLLVPDPVSHSLTVKYNNFKSNTESDLVGIIFPDEPEYTTDLASLKKHKTIGGTPLFNGERINYKNFINDIADRDFNKLEVSIIQCKTNWNDNAQIPMLWDMIYRTKEFVDTGIVVGDKSYSIRNLKRFSYCFVTFPSTNPDKLTPTSTAVQRVRSLSGGNYWGRPSKHAVAESVAEIFSRNFHGASSKSGLRVDLASVVPKLVNEFAYFFPHT